MPQFTVCIPSFNRPEFIDETIQSITQQNFNDFNLLVSDDNSPKYQEILEVVNKHIKMNPEISISLEKNDETLGYDGNLRTLIEKSTGNYCVIMGDDDLLHQGALKRINQVILENPNLGVIIRAWQRLDRKNNKVMESYRYFSEDRFFESGPNTISTFFRRSVAISAYTVKKDLAREFSTNRFDGTLLYQLYLSGMILIKSNAYYISDVIVSVRKDIEQKPTHFFGTAKAERGKFAPGKLNLNHSYNFVKGMIEIADYISSHNKNNNIFKLILKDIGNYSYPILSVQFKNGRLKFIKYFFKLAKLGLWKNLYFYIYFFGLFILGIKNCEKIIIKIKVYMNHTPYIGNLYTGEKSVKK